MLTVLQEAREIAVEVIRIASTPAEWMVASSFLATISTTKKAIAALLAVAVGAFFVGGIVATTAVGALRAIDMVPALVERQEAMQEERRLEIAASERRSLARITDVEVRVGLWEVRFEQLRCEIIQALDGPLPTDCDQRLLR